MPPIPRRRPTDQNRPNSADLGPESINIGPVSAEITLKLTKSPDLRPESATCWPKSAKTRLKSTKPEHRQIRLAMGPHEANSTNVGWIAIDSVGAADRSCLCWNVDHSGAGGRSEGSRGADLGNEGRSKIRPETCTQGSDLDDSPLFRPSLSGWS